jgi:hypothetical protein
MIAQKSQFFAGTIIAEAKAMSHFKGVIYMLA